VPLCQVVGVAVVLIKFSSWQCFNWVWIDLTNQIFKWEQSCHSNMCWQWMQYKISFYSSIEMELCKKVVLENVKVKMTLCTLLWNIYLKNILIFFSFYSSIEMELCKKVVLENVKVKMTLCTLLWNIYLKNILIFWFWFRIWHEAVYQLGPATAYHHYQQASHSKDAAREHR